MGKNNYGIELTTVNRIAKDLIALKVKSSTLYRYRREIFLEV